MLDEQPLDAVLADAGDAQKAVATLMKLLKGLSETLVQQYVLTHIEDILSDELYKVSAAALVYPGSGHFPCCWGKCWWAEGAWCACCLSSGQRALLFSTDGGKTFDAAPFLRAIEHGDLYCKKTASTILALLFQVREGSALDAVGDAHTCGVGGREADTAGVGLLLLVPCSCLYCCRRC